MDMEFGQSRQDHATRPVMRSDHPPAGPVPPQADWTVMENSATETPRSRSQEAQSLIRRVVEALDKGEYNPVEINMYRQGAKRISRRDPAMSHTVLGIVASLERDHAELHRCFGNAMQFADGAWQVTYIYANTLMMLGSYSEAAAIACEGCQRHPGQVGLLNSAIQACFRSGRILNARQWLAVWWGHSPDETHPLEPLVLRLESFYLQYDLNDAVVERMQRLAIAGLHQKNLHPRDIEMTLVHSRSGDRLRCDLPIPGVDDATLAGLQQTLENRLALAKIPPVVRKRISFHYVVDAG